MKQAGTLHPVAGRPDPKPRILHPPNREDPPAGPDRRPAWRLIVDPAADPVWNMAVDRALLRCQDGPGTEPVLRLYGWTPPAVSLGRFQPPLSPAGREFCASRGISVVRRPTGGGSVLHADEVTYSLIAGLDRPPFPRSVIRIYERIAEALRNGLAILGLEVEPAGGRTPVRRPDPNEPCFARLGRWELAWKGRKILGSAQARFRRRFLQHGSLPIRLDRRLLLRAVGGRPEQAGSLPAASLEEGLGRRPTPEEVRQAMVRGFEETFAVRLRPGDLTVEERSRAVACASEVRVGPAG